MSNVLPFIHPSRLRREAVQPLRVLVVHDDAAARQALVRLLENGGHQVSVAATGKAALERIPLEGIEVAMVADWLSDMDVIGFLRACRRACGAAQRVSVVALTDAQHPTETDELLQAGVAGILDLPTVPPALGTLLRDLPRSGQGQPLDAEVAPSPMLDFDSSVLDELASLGLGIEFEREFIGQCISDLSGILREMEMARAIKAWDAVREHAHSIKGVAANAGLARMANVAAAVVRAPDWRLVAEGGGAMIELRDAFAQGREKLVDRLAAHEAASQAV